jgi:hypothetical protein
VRSQSGRGAFAWVLLSPALVFAEPEPAAAETGARAAPTAYPAVAQEPGQALRAEPLVLISLGAELGAGLAPKLALGPAASVVVTPARHLRLGLLGSIHLPHQYGAAPGLELEHSAIGTLACGMPRTGSFGVGLCGTGKLHRFHSTGISLPHPEAQRSLAWTLGLALRAEWRLVRRLWWVGSVGADVATSPLYFYFTPAGGGESVLFRQGRVAPSLFLGLTLELP